MQLEPAPPNLRAHAFRDEAAGGAHVRSAHFKHAIATLPTMVHVAAHGQAMSAGSSRPGAPERCLRTRKVGVRLAAPTGAVHVGDRRRDD